VKQAFSVPTVRLVGELQHIVNKVAVLGGAGSRYIQPALFAGADVLITGDIDYHSAQDALAAGLILIDPGHNVEKIMKRHVAEYLTKQLLDKKYVTRVIASSVDTEVFKFV
jgi:putative NIF3 family GTP cyclohydrolase 1 type 2